MSSIFTPDSLFVLFALMQIAVFVSRLWANKVDERDWKDTLWRMFILIAVVAIVYLVFVSVFNIVLSDNINKDLVMMEIGIALLVFGLLFEFIFDPFKIKNKVDKSEFTHPPKPTKKPEFLHPPKSISKTTEQ